MIPFAGQKVVNFRHGDPVVMAEWLAIGAIYPTLGEVYTIRAVFPREGRLVLHLVEIDNSHLDFDDEPGFDSEYFRPLVERKTDISIFQAMLTPSPVTVDAMNVADHAREIVG
jgi:hypothetical protein